jgi:hypothetical protein
MLFLFTFPLFRAIMKESILLFIQTNEARADKLAPWKRVLRFYVP